MTRLPGNRSTWLALTLVMLATVGCGGLGPQRYAIHGTVLLDGQPVKNATIVFTPVGPGLSAAASIVDGKFALSTLDGPTAGNFDVRINPHELELEDIEAAPEMLAKANRKPSIPKIYQQNGKLTAAILDQPEQVLQFNLSSKGN